MNNNNITEGAKVIFTLIDSESGEPYKVRGVVTYDREPFYFTPTVNIKSNIHFDIIYDYPKNKCEIDND